MAPARSLAEWLTYVESLHPKKWDLGLARVNAVASRLGLLPVPGTVFLIAGTNGKGSTCEYIDQLCRATGRSVGKSTSPHLLHFNERIQVDGVPAADAEIADAFSRIEQARGEISLTYFEFSALASLLIFRAHGVDVSVLEVGLGGRLDAMNIVDPSVTVITQIALDHQEWLGNDRGQIAAEKAGIMRAGKPCIVTDRSPPDTLVSQARKLGAIAYYLGSDFETTDDHLRLKADASGVRLLARPNDLQLPIESAIGALQAVVCAGITPSSAQVGRVLSTTALPGRRHWVAPNTILDVAHNPAAARYLRDHLDSLDKSGVHGVIGMYRDKDYGEVLRLLSGSIDQWYLTNLPDERAADARELADALPHGCRARCYDKITSAFNDATRNCAIDDVIVVFGSFPVVAGVLQATHSSTHSPGRG